jgi:hypothetical protein
MTYEEAVSLPPRIAGSTMTAPATTPAPPTDDTAISNDNCHARSFVALTGWMVTGDRATVPRRPRRGEFDIHSSTAVPRSHESSAERNATWRRDSDIVPADVD